MGEFIAESLTEIAQRLKEIEEERRKERQAAEPPPEATETKPSYPIWP